MRLTPATDSLDAPTRRVRVRPSAADGFASGFDGFRDGFDDDDDYVEYTLSPAPAAPPRPSRAATPPRRPAVVEPQTEPLATHKEHPRTGSGRELAHRTGRVVAQPARRHDDDSGDRANHGGPQRLSRRRRTAFPPGRGIPAADHAVDPRTVPRRHRHLRRVDLPRRRAQRPSPAAAAAAGVARIPTKAPGGIPISTGSR